MSSEGLYIRFIVRALCVGLIVAPLSCPARGSEGTRAVSRASCGQEDRPESVQGQTMIDERFGSASGKPYTCNLKLVGQYEGEGADGGLARFDDCAYFSTAPNPNMKDPGVVVLDVSDSTQPKATTHLTTPAMLHAHKSLEVSRARQLLLAHKATDSATDNAPSNLDIYDISDCRHPVLRSSTTLPAGIRSHMGHFSSDGSTFYAANFVFTNPLIVALDVRDPSKPHLVSTWAPPKDKVGWITHGIVINKEATRAYVSMKRMTVDWNKKPVTAAESPNGLIIFDISDVQATRADAQFRLISTLFWDDTEGAGGMVTVKIKGAPHLVFSDTLGTLSYHGGKRADGCNFGKPGHGFARIIDIGDEKHPKIVSKLILEVSEPNNCSKSMHDPTWFGSYGSAACSVDNENDGRLLACSNFEGGLRVFDIRDAAHPRELAYYKPGARRTQDRPGSLFRFGTSPVDRTADSALAAPQFQSSRNEIWFTSFDNGFQVVRFSDRFIELHSDLFEK